MNSKNLLMFGVVLVGVMILAGSVSAALFTVTANPDRILVNKKYNVTVTVTPCNGSATVRLSGCDDKVGSDNGTVLPITGDMTSCTGVFVNLKSRKDDCKIKVEAIPNGYSYSDTTPDWITVKEDSSSKRDLEINITPVCVGETLVVIVKDKRLQKPVKEVDISVYLGEKTKADYYIKDSRGLTDDDGRYEFIPTQAGIHTLSFERSGYRYVEVRVDICDEAPETSTTVTETTTVSETTVTETTVKETTTAATTSVKETTTAEETTTAKETTTVKETTTIEDGGGLDGGMMVVILIVIVGIGGLVYFLTMRGKGGEAEEEAAESTEAVEEAAEEIPEETTEELTEEE